MNRRENKNGQSIYRRKVLFLYPSIDDFENENIKNRVNDLVESLYYIIRDANENIAKIFSSEVFVNSKSIPIIESQAVNKMHTEVCDNDIHGLRLCVTSFDGNDFSDRYSDFISKENIDKNDISHLLSIKLFSGSKKSVWKTSENESFSASIETGVNELPKIILGIMLDIAFYHYFKLPLNLVYRQSFGLLKKEFLDVSFAKERLKRVYGPSAQRSDIRYLSISMLFVDDIQKEVSSVSKLLEIFTKFYYEHVISRSEVDVNTNSISFNLDALPLDCVEKVKKLVNSLTTSEKNEIIEEYRNLMSKIKSDETLEGKDKIILLLCEDTIFPCMNTKRRKFTVDIDMEPEKYINLEKFYVLFRMDSIDADEV